MENFKELLKENEILEQIIFENHCLNCRYFCGKKDMNNDLVLTLCTHPYNMPEVEGNTKIELCPLRSKYFVNTKKHSDMSFGSTYVPDIPDDEIFNPYDRVGY